MAGSFIAQMEAKTRQEKYDWLVKKLEEAEAKVMMVHSGADENDRDDLDHVINLLNEVMADLKGGME
jgi:hypothetical protein